MHCPDCGHVWSWNVDPIPHCPYCGSVGETDEGDAPEAHQVVAQASGEIFEGEIYG